MRLVSWNVNGIRAALNKGAGEFLASCDADIICLQETRAEPEQIDWHLPGYEGFWNPGKKKGYSGTAILTRVAPLAVTFELGEPEHDGEGRVITAEFADFYLVTVYTPNAQRGLTRLAYRVRWDADFLANLLKLEASKPVIFCGDLNVAHTELDLARPKSNQNNAGFTPAEREGFSRMLAAGFVDSFREFVQEGGHYTWWSNMLNARAKNIGWRIDYFCLSRRLRPRLRAAGIHPEIFGSDHCPVSMELA